MDTKAAREASGRASHVPAAMVRQLGSTVEEIVALREKLQAFTRRTDGAGEDGLNPEV